MIPFNRPYFPNESLAYLAHSIESGFSKGDGPFTEKCSSLISSLSGGGEVVLTPSCTHALELAVLLLELKPGDEVIMPSFTFTSAATSLVNYGVTPVFVDIHARDKNIDCEQIGAAITSKTRAVSFVNYAGVGADFSQLESLAARNGLALIEDNAHGLGGARDGRLLGSVGDLATLSFHESKNFQCGEGGALVINNQKFGERARVIREKGTDRSRFIKGEVQKYQWIDKGSSYLLSDILASVLLPQLERYEQIQENRLESWDFYHTNLISWANKNGVRLQHIPVNAEHTAHMFYFELDCEQSRTHVMSELNLQGIKSVFHYQGLHNSPAGKQYGRSVGSFAETNRVEATLLRIPMFFGMSISEKEKVVEVLNAVKL